MSAGLLPEFPPGCDRISAFDLRPGDFIVWERGRTWRKVTRIEGVIVVAEHGRMIRQSSITSVVGACRARAT